MNIKASARRSIRRTVQALGRRTIFSRVRNVRMLGFDAVGAGQDLVICNMPSKETFVVSARDEIIGRQLFLTGEFDFDKFVAAYQVLLKHGGGKRPRVLIDVGANIGTICIPAVARGYVERAIAVEPDPNNCRLLRANLELNGLASRIRVHESAAGASDGDSLELELSEYNMGDHRIRAPGGTPSADLSPRHSVTVRSARLDTVCTADLNEDLLFWMDVQGFEGFVLAGSGALLQRRVPLVLEFWPEAMARTGSFPLVKEGLAHYESVIDLNAPSKVRPISQLQTLYEEIGEGGNSTDIMVL